jgi:hypothetical protein
MVIDNQHLSLHPGYGSTNGTETLFEEILYIIIDYDYGELHGN